MLIVNYICMVMKGLLSYIVGCDETKKGVVIDPGGKAMQIMKIANEAGLSLDKLASFHLSLSPVPDIMIDKETNIKVGKIEFKIYHTPGHSPGGICFYTQNMLFTGDTLFVGDSGATSLKGGNRPALGASLRRIIMAGTICSKTRGI